MNTPYRQRRCRGLPQLGIGSEARRWGPLTQRGFTLIEVLVVVATLALAIYFAAVGTTGQSSLYYLRGDIDRMVSALQRAAVQSASRGELASFANVRAGVTFYQGRIVDAASEPGGSHSYLGWFEGDPIKPLPRSLTTIGALVAEPRTAVRSLNRETILTKIYTAGSPVVRLADQAFVTYREGRLQVFDVNGFVVSGGHRAELEGFFNQEFSPLASTVPVAYTFDVLNTNIGWVRVRMYTGGFVEVSGLNSLSESIPTNSAGGVF